MKRKKDERLFSGAQICVPSRSVQLALKLKQTLQKQRVPTPTPQQQTHDTALLAALVQNNVEKAAELIKNGANPNAQRAGRTLLHHAIAHRSKECIMLLLAHNANIHAVGPYGNTPLHEAALQADEQKVIILELLLLAGANPNTQNVFGQTPLHFHKHCTPEVFTQMAKLLIKAGAQLHLCDIKGKTPLEKISKDLREELIAYALTCRLGR